jgi:hypothetical protein
MHAAGWALALGGLALGAPACGSPSGESGGRPTETVTLGPADSGRVIHLAPGDRLAVSLGNGFSHRDWVLARYPRAVLSLASPDRRAASFRFDAERAGKGQLLVLDLRSPGPGRCFRKVGEVPSARCPMDYGPKPLSGAGVFRVKIVVT